MAYLSAILGKPVTDVDGAHMGVVRDVIASLHPEQHHPQLVALVVAQHGSTLAIPLSEVAVLIAPAIPLARRAQELTPYTPGEHDLYLARDVLDKQVIDTNGMRVVRVNDLEVTRVNGHYYIANVDMGGLGLLRRLGVEKLAQRMPAGLRAQMQRGIVSWDHVELVPGGQPMRLKVPGARLVELHPADLAEIISDLSRTESSRLMESLDVKTVADTLEEVEPDFQASLVEAMPDDIVADVLEEMAPDEAADLLAELPDERSDQLLELMEEEQAEDVRKLLAYPEDSAGGIMTTEYVALRPDLTASQAIENLRAIAHEAETIYYVYVTDDEEHLLGVFSLRDLVLATPNTPISEFMHQRLVVARLQDSQDEVAQSVSKYSLLAVPVVDDEGRLCGIVTADDALDKVIPTAWKKRLPRLYH